MAFGLAPQLVAQDGTIIFANADSYEVIIDNPAALEATDANFRSLRDPVSYTHLTLPTIYSV